MPKSRDQDRSKQVRHRAPAERPPEREDIERAIEDVLERLKPKVRRAPKPRQEPPARGAVRLSLVPDTGGTRD